MRAKGCNARSRRGEGRFSVIGEERGNAGIEKHDPLHTETSGMSGRELASVCGPHEKTIV